VSEFFNPTQNLLFVETLMSWEAGQFHGPSGMGQKRIALHSTYEKRSPNQCAHIVLAREELYKALPTFSDECNLRCATTVFRISETKKKQPDATSDRSQNGNAHTSLLI
jgi:hypothetical protein